MATDWRLQLQNCPRGGFGGSRRKASEGPGWSRFELNAMVGYRQNRNEPQKGDSGISLNKYIMFLDLELPLAQVTYIYIYIYMAQQ